MPETTAQYRRVRLRDPGSFKPGSFVTITQGEHRVIAGVLKGERRTVEAGDQKGQPRLTPQAILHPIAEGEPCAECATAKLNARR